MTSTARRNSKFKIQNSKLIQRKRFIDLEWVVYLRRVVLARFKDEWKLS
jgi:macrodomain Ter protein organizer (MatP/YcbG family)